jgi:hypothetical protein
MLKDELTGDKNVNLGDYEEKPRITRIRADQDERGEWPIRAYPRNPRLDFFFVAAANRAGSICGSIFQ